ncbi:MAG: gluconate 2-dehydrogenase subunit 3 family protein [Pseudomonadota bacterium]
MSELEPRPALTRRALLERAILLVGGAAALSTLEACDLKNTTFFSANQRAMLDRLCDIIIPQTDTPGALGAGVPAFIDAMMTHWASRHTRSQFSAVLDEVEAKARDMHHGQFLALTPAQQAEVVTAYDSEQIGGKGENYRPLKSLLLLGYYHSEIGATKELHYELVPGHWIADAPLSEIGRTWA